jgi:hypothetical protein
MLNDIYGENRRRSSSGSDLSSHWGDSVLMHQGHNEYASMPLFVDASPRLFQRTTRGLTLTEQGEQFLLAVRGGLDTIQAAIADLTTNAGQPAGVLKISAPIGFGIDYQLPLMPAFITRFPAVTLDW